MKSNKHEVKTIFFDAGGVLFDTPIRGDDRIRNILMGKGFEISSINSAISKAKEIHLPFITTWEEEEHYYKNYYGKIAEELGQFQLTNELFQAAHYARHCELFPEVKSLLMELSKEYELAVISNAMPSMDGIFDRLGIRKYLPTIILSAFEKVEKPDHAIYEIALKRTNTKPEESVFIDDKIENVEEAERVGIKGLYLNRKKQNLMELLNVQEEGRIN